MSPHRPHQVIPRGAHRPSPLAGRWYPADAAALTAEVEGYLEDARASLGPRALEMAVTVLGAHRVMCGTDYPIFTSEVCSNALREARLSEADRAMVASGTALATLARDAARRAG